MKQDVLIKNLKHKLILLFTITTCAILAAVLAAIWITTWGQLKYAGEREFKNSFVAVCNLLRYNTSISDTQIGYYEMQGHGAILIEDNGKPLFFNGAYYTHTDRNILFDRLKEVLKDDGQDYGKKPLTIKEISSSIYEIEGRDKEKYFGAAFVVNVTGGYRSLFMLSEIKNMKNTGKKQGFVFIAIGAMGGILLFLLSHYLIRKVLLPVEESRKSQSEFIAAVSHELKSPLTVIRANAAGLASMKNNPDLFESFSKGIDRECVRMAGLIEDMLLLTFADAGTWNMNMTPVDLDTLLIETYDFFYPFCQEKNKRLTLIADECVLPRIKGDKERLSQILSILIHNAVSYSKDGDEIILRGYTEKKQAVLEVEDHGPGIGDDKKKEIFKRFYRGDKSRKDKSHFGLGLSIAKELAQLHGGDIHVADTKGGGCTFSVVLKNIS